MSRLLVFLPCFEDQEHLPSLISQVLAWLPHTDVLVVDDGSSTPVTNLQPDKCTLIRHETNLGLSAAMKTAAQFALECKASGMIKIDADGEMDPWYLPAFVAALERGADVVLSTFAENRTPPAILRDDQIFRFCFWLVTGEMPASVLAEYRGFSRRALNKLATFDGKRYSSPLHLFSMCGLKWTVVPSAVRPNKGRPFPVQGMLDLRRQFLTESIRHASLRGCIVLPLVSTILVAHAIYNLAFNSKLNGYRGSHVP